MKIIIIILMFCINLYCNEHVKKDITKLNNKLEQAYLESLVISIDKHSKEYKVNPKIVIAIFKAESNFNINAVNYESRDFGIGQINALNMKHYEFDLGKQMTNLDYAIKNTYIILNDLRNKYCSKSVEHTQWFTRYHSYSSARRKIYYNVLKPFLEAVNFKEGGECKWIN